MTAEPYPHPLMVRLALFCYEWLWQGATPLLCRNQRLREGLPQRLGKPFPHGPFDIWIQAASAGEAYLAGQLLESIAPVHSFSILVTTNTRQGYDIIEATLADLHNAPNGGCYQSAYFPFDRPSLMNKAVTSIQPRLMVLLETEIWPGHISALKAAGTPIIIINGRMQAKSLRHYRLWPAFWHELAPDHILAVSPEDRDRYAALYGTNRVSVMPNMKFDRIRSEMTTSRSNPISRLIPKELSMVVLGSVRQEEEEAIDRMVSYLLGHRSDIVIGLFPRHMHRIPSWQRRLKNAGIPCCLRSGLSSPPDPGTVILWDVFGELTLAYASAASVFVGGTLAPLGGQNFLEPLMYGLIPTIGPSWRTFNWVGGKIFEKGLVRVAIDWQSAADSLLDLLNTSPSREETQGLLKEYLAEHQGGTAVAVEAITRLLSER